MATLSINNIPSFIRGAAFVLLLIIAYFVYAPGLKGDFLLDDQGTITRNLDIKIESLSINSLYQAALSSDSGPLKRPISMISFAINYYVHGPNPYYFKLTNLVIHFLNAIIIFVLTKLLIEAYSKSRNLGISKERIYWITFFTTAAWLLHPLNLTSVLYISQRMNSLSALFTFTGLALYVYGRSGKRDQTKSTLAIAAAFLLCLPMATLSKENGALLPLFLLITEITIFQFKTNTPKALSFIKATYLLTVALPALAILCFIIFNPDWLTQKYIIRDFTLYERVLTQCRALFFYLSLALFPRNSAMGIYHDDFQLSNGLLIPTTTILSIAGLLAIIIAAIWLRKKLPLLSFGILFFIAGHSMESSIYPLENIYEHRNYVPIYGILIAIFFFFFSTATAAKHRKLIYTTATLAIVFLAMITYERASYWGNPFLLHLFEVKNHPQSARTHYEVGRIYAKLIIQNKGDINDNYKAAKKYFETATTLNKAYTPGLFGLLALNYTVKQPPETEWLETLKNRLRNTPTTGTRIIWLDLLVKCDDTHPCILPSDTIIEIFDSALENPTLTHHSKAAVLSSLANYIGNQLNNPQKALELTYNAVTEAPNHTHYRLNLVRVLISLGKIDKAERELIIADHLDSTNRYKQDINMLKKAIEESRKTIPLWVSY